MNTGLINTNNPSIYTPQYTLVSNVSTLNLALQPLFQAEVLAIDCETTGLDPLTDSIRLIQIAVPNHPVVLIDLPAIPKSDRPLLKKLLCNSAVKIAHNAKFDWQFLARSGLKPSGQFFDTQLAYKVLTAGLKTSSSLQNIVKKLLHLQLDKTQQISDWYNSPQQVLAALQAIGIKINSTNQSKLVSLAAQYPIIQALLDYRRLSKIIGTFTEKLPQHIHPKTGRIHPNYYQLGAKSGRFSCRKPPLQNIPRDEAARSCFIAAPGYKIIKADYSQIELRIMARLSGDTKMCQVYRQGADLHRLTASLVTGKYINEVTEEDRRLAKAINFGLIFGMGAAKLQIYAQIKYGVAMTLEQAKAFSQRFFEAYPGIARWHENIKRKYIQGIKESRTLANRRRRWVNKPRLSELFNHPVQGLNADINKLAMVKLSTTLAKFRTKLICVRHDEIVLECPETEVDQVRHILHNCMVAAAQKFLTPIPVVIDIKISNSW